jgi:lipopolysaccharide exporter
MNNNFIGDVTKLSVGTAFAQGLGIVVLPIITRLYAPDALGLSLIFISIVTILGAVACLRYEQAVILPADDKEAVNLFAASILIAIVVTVALTLVARLFYQPFLKLLNAEALHPYLWLFGPTVFLGATLHALNVWNSRTRRFFRLSVARVASALMLVSVQVGAALFGFSDAGSLIIAHFLALLTTTFLLAVQIAAADGLLFQRSIEFSRVLDGMMKHRRFPIYGTWSELLNMSANQLPTFLLSAFFSTTVVGYYGLAARLLRMPITLLGNAIAQVFYQRASVAYSQDNLPTLTHSVYHSLFVFGIFPALLLTLVGEDLFTILFGTIWMEAGRYTQILSPLSLFVFVGLSLVSLPNIIGRQESGLIFYGALFVIQGFALWVGGLKGSATLALLFLSSSSIAVWLFYIAWIFKHVGLSLKVALLSPMAALLLSAASMSLLVITKESLHLTNWPLLLSGIVACLFYYILLFNLDTRVKDFSQPYLHQIRRFMRL